MNKTYLVDGTQYEVGPSKEKQFLEDFKDKNPTLQDDKLGKSTGADQPRNNQTNTESPSGNTSSDFILSPDALNNLLNEEYSPHISRIRGVAGGVPNPGRFFSVNLKYEF